MPMVRFLVRRVCLGVVDVANRIYPATFTEVVSGHFHSVNNSGVQRAAGTYQESVSYNDGSVQTCPTNVVPFSVTRDNQGVQTTAAPASGSYSGDGLSNNYPVSFSVTGATISALSATDYPECYPNNVQLDPRATVLSIPEITIQPDGSFVGTATGTRKLTINNVSYQATFRETVTGNFHSLNNNGLERAAGTYTETITYNDGSPETCSSNLVPFYATN